MLIELEVCLATDFLVSSLSPSGEFALEFLGTCSTQILTEFQYTARENPIIP